MRTPAELLEGHPTRYWHRLDDGRVQCDVCPRACRLHPGQRGMCFVRGRGDGDAVLLTTYGRSTGFCIDPIEKKPLSHFLPGTPVLSFGTAGCNLACKFCQNWESSKSREMDSMMATASPEGIATAAARHGCRSVAFTYNDPTIFLEYAVDTAGACHEAGLKTVSVTAGYICEAPRAELYEHIDAANVDLKAFSEDFYWRVTASHLEPVLETLVYLAQETDVWLEVTTLVIEGYNDDDRELRSQFEWMAEHLGPHVPLHLSAFHPDFRMLEVPRTSRTTLRRARRAAMDCGLRFVYTGNVHDAEGDTTFCPSCEATLIQRDWYQLLAWGLDADGRCSRCRTPVPGVFESEPGDWGRRRVPILVGA